MEPISTTILLKYGAIAGFLLIKYFQSKNGAKIKPVKGLKLGILGMKQAGKTRLYCHLNPNMEFVEGQTYIEPYDCFSYKKSDGTVIDIAEGEDIGGGDDEAKEFMHKYLQEKDAILFIFDITKYMKDIEYKDCTNARIDYIYNYKKEGTYLCFLLSHIDQFKNSIQAAKSISSFKDEIKTKPYGKMVLSNYAPIDVTDSTQLRRIESRLFP